MQRFLQKHADRIAGVLSGFDRLVFRGTLIPLVLPHGMFRLLTKSAVRLLDFKDYVLKTSENVKKSALAEAVDQERPVRYLQSASTSKEDLVRRLLDEQPVDGGLICAFTAVEPCMSFE